MFENKLAVLKEHPGLIEVSISDQEGLLICAVTGMAHHRIEGTISEQAEMFNAVCAQFSTTMSTHFRQMTIAAPRDIAVEGPECSLLIMWLPLGWLMALVETEANRWQLIRELGHVRDEVSQAMGTPG